MTIAYTHITVDSTQPFYGLSSAIEILNKEKDQADFVIFLEHLWEHNLHINLKEIEKFVKIVKESRPNWKIFLLMNAADNYYYDQTLKIGLNGVLSIEYFIFLTWQQIVVNKISSVLNRTTFDSTPTNKFLFLLGKPAKPNRIRLLKKFVDADLINQCDWSFINFKNQIRLNRRLREQLPELSDASFNSFVQTYKRDLDQVQIYKDFKEFELNSMYYDVGIYRNTDFSIIAETTFSNKPVVNPWVTEKTWKTILNHHPFIFAGDVGGLAYIRSLGFETYDHMLAVPHYDEISNIEDRLNAIVINTRYWLENDFHQEQIEIAHFNLTRLKELYKENLDKILNFQLDHNMLHIPLESFIRTGSRYFGYSEQARQDELFVKFYNNIKDPDWPEVAKESDFDVLPEHVQNECINVFGYSPQKRK